MRQKILLLGILTLAPAITQLHASLTTSETGMAWDLSAFSPVTNATIAMPSFYVGGAAPALNPTSAQQALVLARSSFTVSGGNASVNIAPLAPATTTLNGAAGVVNPLTGNQITNLALLNAINPVVTSAANPENVYLITSPTDGSLVLSNITPINDAGGAATQGVAALTGAAVTIGSAISPTNIIAAAVSANGSTGWNDPAGVNRGIAVLTTNAASNGLATTDATNFANMPGNMATKLSLAATDQTVPPVGPVAFYDPTDAPNVIATAILAPQVDMFFDNTNLQRLYIGLTNAERDDNTKAGGVLGVLMGRIDTVANPAGALVLQPVVNGVSKDLFYDGGPANQNINDRIVGFYADGVLPNGQAAFAATINQINTMHTSTNKDYLIVNSAVVGHAGTEEGVFALPLLGTIQADGKTAVPVDQIGTISQVNRTTISDGIPTFNVPPAAFDQMPLATDSAVAVGVDTSALTPFMTDIFVQGDTVYMCAADNTANTGNLNSGIFASTAIFGGDGSISAWSPVQRVMGSINGVFGGALDTMVQPGDFYALTSENLTTGFNNVDTVQITQWGTSDSVTAQQTTVNNLSSLLATLFPVENGGVIGLYSFDQNTPGFLPNKFAMMVAVGVDTIALIQTASFDPVALQFVLTQNFAVGTNVFVRSAATDPALAAIMPLTGAEVSRINTATNSGWLFVCGLNGVAVLSLANGNGWLSGNPPAAGLSALQADDATHNLFPGGTNWTFKQLTPTTPTNMFIDVRKLIASAGRMYVATLNGVFFFDMAAGKFDGVPSTALTESAVAGLDDRLIADMVVLSINSLGATPATDNFGVIATDDGIWLSQLSTVPAQTVQVPNTSGLELALQLVGNVPSRAPVTGNVYALLTDFENNNDTLYRYYADSNAGALALANLITPVPQPNLNGSSNLTGLTEQFNNTVQDFMTDGTFDYSTLPKDYGSTNYLTLSNVGTASSADVTPLLGLNFNVNTYISGVLRDGASGAIMVPGDWGVRVNQ